MNVGKTLKEMIVQDMKGEQKAVDMHKELIALDQKQGDVKTAFQLMEISTFFEFVLSRVSNFRKLNSIAII
jgi:bacterioferritin (cytochrome b1)